MRIFSFAVNFPTAAVQQQGMIDAENSAKWVDINSEGAILHLLTTNSGAVIVTTFYSPHTHYINFSCEIIRLSNIFFRRDFLVKSLPAR